MLVRYGILFLGALFGGPALGADLNTPLNDKPTVGTEINRGAAAAFQCNLRYVVDLLRFSECVSDAASADEQRHPDYSSFQLGLYWQECVVLSIHIEPDKHGRTDLSASDLRFAKTTLALSYDQFRTRQKRIGLTDEQLVTAYAAGDPAWRPLVQQLHDWEKNPPKQP